MSTTPPPPGDDEIFPPEKPTGGGSFPPPLPPPVTDPSVSGIPPLGETPGVSGIPPLDASPGMSGIPPLDPSIGSFPPSPPAQDSGMGAFPPPPQFGQDDAPGGYLPTPGMTGGVAAVRNQKAMLSLILGVAGMFCFGGVLGVAAIILGFLARKEIDASGGTQTGRGLATAGMVLGAIAILSFVFLLSAGGGNRLGLVG